MAKPPPLSPYVRIVDPETGLPTPEFMRWWQEQSDTNGTITVFDDAAATSTVLDLIGASQGTVLYRSASGWVVLPPGTVGQALTTGGANVDPAWADVVSAFLDLTDAPADYTGAAGNAVLVKATEDGLEFGAVSGGGGGTTLATSTHWRINSFTAGSATGNSMAEVVLRDENGATLTPASVAAFSEFGAAYSADKATDGNTATFWSSNGLHAGEWFEFVFATDVNIAALDITARNDTDSNQTPTDFSIQYSTDGGATFSTLGATAGGLPDFAAGETRTFDVSTLTVVSGGPSHLVEYSVAGLPASPGTGAQALVSDSNSTTFGSIVVGGGVNPVPVYFDGTNWRIG